MIINLCSLPFLSLDYSNVLDFSDVQSRKTYFENKTKKSIDVNIKYDAEQTFCVVPLKVEECRNYDYLYYVDSKGKPWYYFITNIVQVTQTTTKFLLKLDVWTSYLFTYNIMPSFIERCHVPRWEGDIPTYNMEEEDIGIGEYIQKENEEIFTMTNSVVISTSVPIGFVQKTTGSGGGVGDGTSWTEGKLSSKGFRFIKGFEGFAPSKYQDSGGYWTIAYGVTLHGEKDIYNTLVSESPINEERGAKVSYDLKNSNYGAKILDSVRNLGCTTQNQFDALCSLAYNCGNGAITGSNSLTNAISLDPTNENVIRPIWEKFYTSSGGTHLPGLVERRKQECNMFFGKEFETRPIGLINSSGNVSGTVTDNNGDGWLPQDDNIGDIKGYKIFDNSFGKFMCPVKNATVTSKYGWRIHPITNVKTFHHGTDLGLPTGSPTVASVNGIISDCGFSSSMGNYIYLDSGDYRTKYMHLSKIQVSKGATVKQGIQIGEIGSTGNSTGAHCHWEIRRISDNESCDPAPTLMKGDKV